MRNNITQFVLPLNPTTLTIHTDGELTAGGCHSQYQISDFDTQNNPSAEDSSGTVINATNLKVVFQNGDPTEVGANGVTMEALIAICRYRLQELQSGLYPCAENTAALEHLTKAQTALDARTLRMAKA